MAIPLNLSEVPNMTPYIQYIADSGQTVYPYPFPITQDSDLVVVINGVTLATDTGYSLPVRATTRAATSRSTSGPRPATSSRCTGTWLSAYHADLAEQRVFVYRVQR